MRREINEDYYIQTLEDYPIQEIEQFFAENADYSILSSGASEPKREARELFSTLPEGKTLEDKFVFGIFERAGKLIGLIDLVKNYPEQDTWIIGLMLLSTQNRRQNIGKLIHVAGVKFVKKSGCKKLRLGVLEQNIGGLCFWQSLGYKKCTQKEMEIHGKISLVWVLEMDLD